jgi:hypothetical protein
MVISSKGASSRGGGAGDEWLCTSGMQVGFQVCDGTGVDCTKPHSS